MNLNPLPTFKVTTRGHNSYQFYYNKTDYYIVEFRQSNYQLLADFEGLEIFEFSFERIKISKGVDHSGPKIRNTIFSIIDQFLLNNYGALIYICDSSDRKESARHRLFSHRWYSIAKEQFKIDLHTRTIADKELGDIYFTGILMKKDFEFYDFLLEKFNDPNILNK